MALGANLGRPDDALRGAAAAIADLGEVEARSAIYATAPVGGPPGQDDYLNAVLLVRPDPAYREPRDLLTALLAIEGRFGRTRSRRFAARTLDLDLLAVDDLVRHEDGLVLPHPRMMDRPFVLVPLLDVAPTWRHPLDGTYAHEALRRLSTAGVRPSGVAWAER